jgi:glucosamine-6-phosphate deaminase
VSERAEAERALAREIAALIARGRDGAGDVVLGLATGGTPVGVYAELVRLHREAGLDFGRVRTFNLDEYVGLAPEHPCSFRRFMDEALFRHVNLSAQSVHVPLGNGPGSEAALACARYDAAIRAAGGIDLQLLGIGRNGHLAFNEPGSERGSRTRLVELHPLTREDAAGSFPDERSIPTHAITMGIGTILEARRLRVLAFGAKKAEIVRRALRDPIGPALPATYLREHPDVVIWLDREAAALLDR